PATTGAAAPSGAATRHPITPIGLPPRPLSPHRREARPARVAGAADAEAAGPALGARRLSPGSASDSPRFERGLPPAPPNGGVGTGLPRPPSMNLERESCARPAVRGLV